MKHRTPLFARLHEAVVLSRRKRLAKDPSEETLVPSESELVTTVEETPLNRWRDYLQSIVRMLQDQYNTKVVLLGAKPKVPFGTPSDQFTIKGFLRFPEGMPLELTTTFEDSPVGFEALIVEGQLVEPITLF